MTARFFADTNIAVYALDADPQLRKQAFASGRHPRQETVPSPAPLIHIRLIADGVRIYAPVHDAILIEAPLAEFDDVVAHTQAVMRAASAAVLGGFMLESDAKIVRSPERYMDKRGISMWNMVMDQLGLDARKVDAGETATCPLAGHPPN